jgi:hypothetical protein
MLRIMKLNVVMLIVLNVVTPKLICHDIHHYDSQHNGLNYDIQVSFLLSIVIFIIVMLSIIMLRIFKTIVVMQSRGANIPNIHESNAPFLPLKQKKHLFKGSQSPVMNKPWQTNVRFAVKQSTETKIVLLAPRHST